MGEDLVYGTVDSSHFTSGLMSSLHIISFANDKMSDIKTYSHKELLISKVTVDGNALELTRQANGASAPCAIINIL